MMGAKTDGQTTDVNGASILPTAAGSAMPALGEHVGPVVQSAPLEDHLSERVHSSTENSIASGQH